MNEHTVVRFKNISDITFTPALGAMYDGRPIFGKAKEGKAKEGIAPYEELLLPYAVGRRLAINLAKQILLGNMPEPEYGKGDPSRISASDTMQQEQIDALVGKILVSEYQEDKPAQESESDIYMRKIQELNDTTVEEDETPVKTEGFMDKQEVIAELEKRGITHDKRKKKEDLEALLA